MNVGDLPVPERRILVSGCWVKDGDAIAK